MDNFVNFKKERAHPHSVFVLVFSACWPQIRHRSKLTERDWENAEQGLDKGNTTHALPRITTHTLPRQSRELTTFTVV